MARTFNGTNQSMSLASGIVTAYPFSWGCWFFGGLQAAALMAFNIGTAVRYALGSQSGGILRLQTSTGSNNAIAAGAFTANTWQHGLAVAASNTDRRIYTNGVRANNSANSAFAAPDNFTIGVQNGDWWNGRIAEAAIWNVALSDAEVLLLASGINPRSVKPDKLMAYWPIYGAYSPETPFFGPIRELTLVNAPAKGDHVRIYGNI